MSVCLSSLTDAVHPEGSLGSCWGWAPAQHAWFPCPSLSPRSSLKLISIESVMPPNHLILCHPLLLPPSIFPSIRVFSNESVLCIRWPKDWSFSFSPSNEYAGLISFRIDEASQGLHKMRACSQEWLMRDKGMRILSTKVIDWCQ